MGNMQLEQNKQYDNPNPDSDNFIDPAQALQNQQQTEIENQKHFEGIEDVDDEQEKKDIIERLNNNVLYSQLGCTRKVCDDSNLYKRLLKKIDVQQLNVFELQKQNNTQGKILSKKQMLIQKIQYQTLETANYIGFQNKSHNFRYLWGGWGDKNAIVCDQMLINSKNRFDEFNQEHFGLAIVDKRARPARWFYSIDKFKWEMPSGKEFSHREYLNKPKDPLKGSYGQDYFERYEVLAKGLSCKECFRIKKRGDERIQQINNTFIQILCIWSKSVKQMKAMQIQKQNEKNDDDSSDVPKKIEVYNGNQKNQNNLQDKNQNKLQTNLFLYQFFRKEIWREMFEEFLI